MTEPSDRDAPTLQAPISSPARRSGWRRFIPRPKTALIAALIALPLAAVAGVAYATYDYSEKYEGRILPGATIAGVDVGGLSEQGAYAAVKAAIRPQLRRQVVVTWGDRTWKTTPKQLGARSDAAAAVDQALAASGEVSMVDKARMKFLGKDLDFSRDVALSYPKEGVFGFIEGIASGLDRKVRDAYIDYSTGWVEIVEDRTGRRVDTETSGKALLSALRRGDDRARLDVKITKPETTTEDFDQILLLRQSDYELHLYQDGKITHSYTVAVGQPGYPTPTGLYEITLKRYMPTWVNPDPEGWGKSMPDVIPPGPGNPLGLRALNWDAAGIRFHGTSDLGSLGTPASHGCVRLTNDDIIELYDLVDVGTPIVSLP